MSRAKTSLAALAIVLCACATAPDPQEKELSEALEAAMKPATPEEIAAANRADPLTKANFWAKEHSKDPENLDVALSFVTSLRGIGSNERAIEVLSQVLVVHPGNPDLLMALGRVMATEGNTLGSAKAFENATYTAPDRAETWAALGTALDKLERHKDAQTSYAQALSIEPNRTSTLTNYGLSLALTGDLPGAEAKLRQAAAQPDADLRVTENLALILGLQGRYDEMAEISGQHAPEGIVEENAKLLQQMIKPIRSWESLSDGAEPGKLPHTTQAPAPLPATAERVNPASSTPVKQESLSLVGEPEGQDQPAATATGLRLGRTKG